VKAANGARDLSQPVGISEGTNRAPLTMLEPPPDFEKVITASGGYGERVDDPDELAPALQRALHAVKVEKRQALLNVICQMV
jgi:acetolactate synthase-1/2/3 large subunit